MTDLNRRTFLGSAAAIALISPDLARAQAATPVKGGTLKISLSQAAAVIQPLMTRVGPEYLVTELLYSNLTRLEHDMSASPDLALSWEPNADLTEWTFRLRQGVTFHDGAPCTSDDVVATFEAILDPANGSPARNNIGPVDTVTAADPHTVVFKLKAAYADLPVAVAYTDARIIPAGIARGDLQQLATTAIGTGPFKLVSYDPDRLIVVERNAEYYDPERPYLDRVEMHVYPDASAESSALMDGETDLSISTEPTEFLRMQGADGVDLMRVASGQFLNVNCGCDAKPFDDVRVRQALGYCVDREAMVNFVTEGFGTVGNDTPINASYYFFDKDLPIKTQDVEKAKALLAEAGYPDGIELTLIASDNPPIRTQMAVALREMAKPAGFTINVQTMPHATYLDQVWKKGNFYIGLYNMQPSADGIFKLLYTSDASWNETRWNNKEFDKLIADARGTTDEAVRADLYAKAQVLMNREVPSMIPCFFDILGAKRSWVQGYDVHPRGAVYLIDRAWLTEDAPRR
jgi:peptide/nickel transport system substrate-binding protein